jgi:hypothetical protein
LNYHDLLDGFVGDFATNVNQNTQRAWPGAPGSLLSHHGQLLSSSEKQEAMRGRDNREIWTRHF